MMEPFLTFIILVMLLLILLPLGSALIEYLESRSAYYKALAESLKEKKS